MKRLTLRFTIALCAFVTGIIVTSLLVINRHAHLKLETQSPACIPVYQPHIAAEHFREDDNPKAFAAFRELPLNVLPDCVNESYRLMWFPTFHSPVVVRVWRSGNNHFIIAKQLSGRGGYELGAIDTELTRSLSEGEWLQITNLLNQASFWELFPTVPEPLPHDGAAWIIEGVKDGKYQWARRTSPSKQYAAICEHLITLSSLKTNHELYLPQSSTK